MGLFSKKVNNEPSEVEKTIVNENTNTESLDDDLFDDMELDENSSKIVQLNKNDNEENDVSEETTEDEIIESEELPVNNKKDKKKGSTTPSLQEEKEYILYIITDRKNPYMLEYMRQFDINVTRIFTNITEAKDTLLMQVNPAKIVIVDTGTGRFSTIGQRKELIDLMGIADDEAMISVYQTDTVLRSEIKYNEAFDSRDIHWHKYKSTADIVAHLLNNKGREKYVIDLDDKEEIQEIPSNILQFKGLPFLEPQHMDVNMGSAALKLSDILNNMTLINDKENELESYIPRY